MKPAHYFRVLTIGHSTRPLEEFVALLKAHEVARLVDVRTIPRSRHNPQFNKETLAESLATDGIAYSHFPGLGGLRPKQANSINTGWRNASFRAYADYMQTAQFEDNLRQLIEAARLEQVAIMCAEAVPWRCHRSLVADALLARGIAAEEIVNTSHTEPHKLTAFAQVQGTTVTYPSPEPTTEQLF
ncbi:MAG TPA: DUF488 domain-containing protein [Methylophilaceae bacterium]|nr:DUF488 domain-containing protein [Methylophilaceae bacterium]